MGKKYRITAKKMYTYLGIVVAVLLILYYLPTISKIYDSVLESTKDIRPAGQNEKLILLTRFNNMTKESDVDIRLQEAFDRAYWATDVRVEVMDSFIVSNKILEMSRQGKIFNATIVIGGRLDNLGIKPFLFIPKIAPFVSDENGTQQDFFYEAEPLFAIAATELGLAINDVLEHLKNHSIPIISPQVEFQEIPSTDRNYNEILTQDLSRSLIYISKSVLGIIYYLEGDFENAQLFLDRAVKLTNNYLLWPLNIANLLYYAGRAKLERKEYNTAENYFVNSLDITDSKITTLRNYVYLALIEYKRKEYNNAKRYCEIVLSENIEDGYYFTKSDRYNLYLYYARACYDLGEYKLADKYFSKLYAEKEDTSKSMLAELNFKIGLSKYFDENYEESISFLYRAYKSDTTNAKFLYWMGVINGIFNKTDSCCYYLSKAYYAAKDSMDRADVIKLMSKLGCD